VKIITQANGRPGIGNKRKIEGNLRAEILIETNIVSDGDGRG